jgi:hypothetical protein
MTKNDRLAKQLADAIQRFRQLPMLGRLTRLRGTPEYAELVAAWEAYRDSTPGFKNAAPRPKDHWPIPCPHEGDEAFCRDCWASHADAEPYCADKEYKEQRQLAASELPCGGNVAIGVDQMRCPVCGETLRRPSYSRGPWVGKHLEWCAHVDTRVPPLPVFTEGHDHVQVGDPSRLPTYGNQAIGADVLRALTGPPLENSGIGEVEPPMCRTCDCCEPRKNRCRMLESLPMVGEYLDGDDAPDWCPIRCTFHIAAPGGDP